MRDPDRARFLKAVDHVEQDEVPFFELEVDFTHVERVLGRPVEARRSYDLAPADYVEFLQRTGMDVAYLHVPWKLGRREGMDGEGRSYYIDGTIREAADVRKIRDPGLDGIRARIEEMLEATDGTRIGTMYNISNTPFIVTTAMGYERYYMALMDDSELVRECFRRVDEIVARRLETVLSYPLDAIMVVNILCMNTGPLFSRDIMEEFELPYLRRHVESSRESGKIVAYHCDGDNTSLYRTLLDLGIQIFQAIEPCGGRQDIYSLKDLYGDGATFHGNIDVGGVLMHGDTEDVEREVAEQVSRLAVGGGYVCGSSHDINEQVPHENFSAMIAAIHAGLREEE